MNRRRIALTLATGASAVLLLTAGNCSSNTPADQQADNDRLSAYEQMLRDQPAVEGRYSPTRETINFWKNTWMSGPGSLSYVYLIAADGNLVGYYIFEGLPVSYCASINRPYTWEDIPGDGGSTDTMVPAPADDGVYYSGAQCNQYYGREAVTGAYREFTVGGSLNYTLSSEPLPRQDVEPIGISIEEVEQALDD